MATEAGGLDGLLGLLQVAVQARPAETAACADWKGPDLRAEMRGFGVRLTWERPSRRLPAVGQSF